jgi:hypothetical protein
MHSACLSTLLLAHRYGYSYNHPKRQGNEKNALVDKGNGI